MLTGSGNLQYNTERKKGKKKRALHFIYTSSSFLDGKSVDPGFINVVCVIVISRATTSVSSSLPYLAFVCFSRKNTCSGKLLPPTSHYSVVQSRELSAELYP